MMGCSSNGRDDRVGWITESSRMKLIGPSPTDRRRARAPIEWDGPSPTDTRRPRATAGPIEWVGPSPTDDTRRPRARAGPIEWVGPSPTDDTRRPRARADRPSPTDSPNSPRVGYSHNDGEPGVSEDELVGQLLGDFADMKQSGCKEIDVEQLAEIFMLQAMLLDPTNESVRENVRAAEHRVWQQREESGQNSNWSYSSGVMSVKSPSSTTSLW